MPEMSRPKEQGEEETESRQDHHQERVEETPDKGIDGQLSVMTTGIDDTRRYKTHHFRKPRNRTVAQASSHHTTAVRMAAKPSPPNVHMRI